MDGERFESQEPPHVYAPKATETFCFSLMLRFSHYARTMRVIAYTGVALCCGKSFKLFARLLEGPIQKARARGTHAKDVK